VVFERLHRRGRNQLVGTRQQSARHQQVLHRAYGRRQLLSPAQESFPFSPKPPSPLPAETPAWTDHGQIVIGPASLWMPSLSWETMLRHEDIHRLQQRSGPYSENSTARSQAEHHARSGSLLVPSAGVPSILGFPVQQHSPWNQVWIGHVGLVGEIVEGGIFVRILLEWSELGIKTSADYHCGKNRAPKKITEVVTRMRAAARAASALNQYLPVNAKAQRTSLIAIMGKGSSSRVWRGGGVILLNQNDFFSSTMEDTVAHEGSHGVFEQHSIAQGKPEQRKPDAVALRIADLYHRLGETKSVPVPKAQFDPKKPPALKGKGKEHESAAGWVMVMDTLWSGAGGHPWDGVDEFFASAFSGYLRQPERLKQIFAYYSKADPALPALTEELIRILEAQKQGNVTGITAPADQTEATAALKRVAVIAPLEELGISLTEGRLDWILDPTKLPSPDKIYCATPQQKQQPPSQSDLDDLLNFDQPAETPKPAGRK
jgi:hypothetical protein